LYNSNVISVLLYGSECNCVTQKNMGKLDAFHNGCLHRIWVRISMLVQLAKIRPSNNHSLRAPYHSSIPNQIQVFMMQDIYTLLKYITSIYFNHLFWTYEYSKLENMEKSCYFVVFLHSFITWGLRFYSFSETNLWISLMVMMHLHAL
jgi:hypothetical protein